MNVRDMKRRNMGTKKGKGITTRLHDALRHVHLPSKRARAMIAAVGLLFIVTTPIAFDYITYASVNWEHWFPNSDESSTSTFPEISDGSSYWFARPCSGTSTEQIDGGDVDQDVASGSAVFSVLKPIDEDCAIISLKFHDYGLFDGAISVDVDLSESASAPTSWGSPVLAGIKHNEIIRIPSTSDKGKMWIKLVSTTGEDIDTILDGISITRTIMYHEDAQSITVSSSAPAIPSFSLYTGRYSSIILKMTANTILPLIDDLEGEAPADEELMITIDDGATSEIEYSPLEDAMDDPISHTMVMKDWWKFPLPASLEYGYHSFKIWFKGASGSTSAPLFVAIDNDVDEDCVATFIEGINLFDDINTALRTDAADPWHYFEHLTKNYQVDTSTVDAGSETCSIAFFLPEPTTYLHLKSNTALPANTISDIWFQDIEPENETFTFNNEISFHPTDIDLNPEGSTLRGLHRVQYKINLNILGSGLYLEAQVGGSTITIPAVKTGKEDSDGDFLRDIYEDRDADGQAKGTGTKDLTSFQDRDEDNDGLVDLDDSIPTWSQSFNVPASGSEIVRAIIENEYTDPIVVQYKVKVRLDYTESYFTDDWHVWGDTLVKIEPALRLYGYAPSWDFSTGVLIDGRLHKYSTTSQMYGYVVVDADHDDFQGAIAPDKQYKVIPLVQNGASHNYVGSINFNETVIWDDDNGDEINEMLVQFDVVYAVYQKDAAGNIALVHLYDFGDPSNQEKFTIQDAQTFFAHPVNYVVKPTADMGDMLAYGGYLLEEVIQDATFTHNGIHGIDEYGNDNGEITSLGADLVSEGFTTFMTSEMEARNTAPHPEYMTTIAALKVEVRCGVAGIIFWDKYKDTRGFVSGLIEVSLLFKKADFLFSITNDLFAQNGINTRLTRWDALAATLLFGDQEGFISHQISARLSSEFENRYSPFSNTPGHVAAQSIGADAQKKWDDGDNEGKADCLELTVALITFGINIYKASLILNDGVTPAEIENLIICFLRLAKDLLKILKLTADFSKAFWQGSIKIGRLSLTTLKFVGYVGECIGLVLDIFEIGDACVSLYNNEYVFEADRIRDQWELALNIAAFTVDLIAFIAAVAGASSVSGPAAIIGLAIIIATIVVNIVTYIMKMDELFTKLKDAFMLLSGIRITKYQLGNDGDDGFSLGYREGDQVVMDIEVGLDVGTGYGTNDWNGGTSGVQHGVYWRLNREAIPYFDQYKKNSNSISCTCYRYVGFDLDLGCTTERYFDGWRYPSSLDISFSCDTITPSLEIFDRLWFCGYLFVTKATYATELQSNNDWLQLHEYLIPAGPVMPSTIGGFIGLLQPTGTGNTIFSGSYTLPSGWKASDHLLDLSEGLPYDWYNSGTDSIVTDWEQHSNTFKTASTLTIDLSIFGGQALRSANSIQGYRPDFYEFVGLDNNDWTVYQYDCTDSLEPSNPELQKLGHNSGFIEFWLYTEYPVDVHFKSSSQSTSLFILGCNGGEVTWRYGTGPTATGSLGSWSDGSWHHVSVHFWKDDHDEMTFTVSIDMVSRGQFIVATEDGACLGSLQYYSLMGSLYVDAIGCSWDPNYHVGMNRVPLVPEQWLPVSNKVAQSLVPGTESVSTVSLKTREGESCSETGTATLRLYKALGTGMPDINDQIGSSVSVEKEDLLDNAASDGWISVDVDWVNLGKNDRHVLVIELSSGMVVDFQCTVTSESNYQVGNLLIPSGTSWTHVIPYDLLFSFSAPLITPAVAVGFTNVASETGSWESPIIGQTFKAYGTSMREIRVKSHDPTSGIAATTVAVQLWSTNANGLPLSVIATKKLSFNEWSAGKWNEGAWKTIDFPVGGLVKDITYAFVFIADDASKVVPVRGRSLTEGGYDDGACLYYTTQYNIGTGDLMFQVVMDDDPLNGIPRMTSGNVGAKTVANFESSGDLRRPLHGQSFTSQYTYFDSVNFKIWETNTPPTTVTLQLRPTDSAGWPNSTIIAEKTLFFGAISTTTHDWRTVYFHADGLKIGQKYAFLLISDSASHPFSMAAESLEGGQGSDYTGGESIYYDVDVWKPYAYIDYAFRVNVNDDDMEARGEIHQPKIGQTFKATGSSLLSLKLLTLHNPMAASHPSFVYLTLYQTRFDTYPEIQICQVRIPYAEFAPSTSPTWVEIEGFHASGLIKGEEYMFTIEGDYGWSEGECIGGISVKCTWSNSDGCFYSSGLYMQYYVSSGGFSYRSNFDVCFQVDCEDVAFNVGHGVAPRGFSEEICLADSTPVDGFQAMIKFDATFDYEECKLDGEDLAFRDSSGRYLFHYIEHWNPGVGATIWVKVLEAGTETITMLYGSPLYDQHSDGAATFEFFDDFSAPALDLTRWVTDAGLYTSLASSELRMTRASSTASFPGISTTIPSAIIPASAAFAVDIKWKSNGVDVSSRHVLRIGDGKYGLENVLLWEKFTEVSSTGSTWVGGEINLAQGKVPSRNWYINTLTKESTGFSSSIKDLQYRTLGSSNEAWGLTSGEVSILLSTDSAPVSMSIDWVRVRRVDGSEPFEPSPATVVPKRLQIKDCDSGTGKNLHLKYAFPVAGSTTSAPGPYPTISFKLMIPSIDTFTCTELSVIVDVSPTPLTLKFFGSGTYTWPKVNFQGIDVCEVRVGRYMQVQLQIQGASTTVITIDGSSYTRTHATITSNIPSMEFKTVGSNMDYFVDDIDVSWTSGVDETFDQYDEDYDLMEAAAWSPVGTDSQTQWLHYKVICDRQLAIVDMDPAKNIDLKYDILNEFIIGAQSSISIGFTFTCLAGGVSEWDQLNVHLAITKDNNPAIGPYLSFRSSDGSIHAYNQKENAWQNIASFSIGQELVVRMRVKWDANPNTHGHYEFYILPAAGGNPIFGWQEIDNCYRGIDSMTKEVVFSTSTTGARGVFLIDNLDLSWRGGVDDSFDTYFDGENIISSPRHTDYPWDTRNQDIDNFLTTRTVYHRVTSEIDVVREHMENFDAYAETTTLTGLGSWTAEPGFSAPGIMERQVNRWGWWKSTGTTAYAANWAFPTMPTTDWEHVDFTIEVGSTYPVTLSLRNAAKTQSISLRFNLNGKLQVHTGSSWIDTLSYEVGRAYEVQWWLNIDSQKQYFAISPDGGVSWKTYDAANPSSGYAKLIQNGGQLMTPFNIPSGFLPAHLYVVNTLGTNGYCYLDRIMLSW